MKFAGIAALHILCILFLRLLWKDKNDAALRGRAFTKMGLVSKKKSPRLFQFSIWVDFIFLAILYAMLIIYTLLLIFK